MVSVTSARKSAAVWIGKASALSIVILLTLAATAFAACVTVRVEGSGGTLFAGPTALGTRTMADSGGAPHSESCNALSALDTAAQVGAFPYVLESTYGLYVSSIGGELPVASPPYPGWLYRVNGVSPSVGADQCALKAGDSVLWYYGTWDASPAVAAVPSGYAAVGATATIVAEQLDAAGVASVLESASVVVGSSVATSAADGTAGFRLTAPGDYGVRVSKSGYIRSALGVLHVRYTTSFSALSATGTNGRRGRWALSGRLSGAGKTPAGRRVDLLARKQGASKWTVAGHATVSATGAFKCSVNVASSTRYRASFSGDGEFGPATSAERSVKIR